MRQKRYIYPEIKIHVWKPKQKIGFVWTNNNAESLNHVIKATLDWKQKSIPDLICVLYNLVNSQYNDVRKDFLKTSPYVLSDEYKSFMLSVDAWSKKTNAQKDEYFNKFLDQKIMRLNTVQPRKSAEKKSDKGSENDRIEQ